jgi:hypothetical protein
MSFGPHLPQKAMIADRQQRPRPPDQDPPKPANEEFRFIAAGLTGGYGLFDPQSTTLDRKSN